MSPGSPAARTAVPVCRDGDAVPQAIRGAVVAIGNFDGVHRGHRKLIDAACAEAARLGRPTAVLTFEPHPRKFFQPDIAFFRLTPEPVKLAVLARTAIDGVFIRRFDAALAALSPDAFVDRVLIEALQASGVVVGHDFHFGRGRAGTPEGLAALSAARGLTCRIVDVVREGGAIVSSTGVRRALESGDVAEANQLLGYRWFVRAEVRHGDKRGRTLGYPTANLRLADDCQLRHGIYAVRVATAEDGVRDAVASFGRRPTFDNGAPLLEAHLFDFAGDLYGLTLDVEFVGWIRGEEKFDAVEALVARMDEDARQAKAVLARDRVRSMIA
jgi:riboflavin kinase/FMN adenylyltransferase